MTSRAVRNRAANNRRWRYYNGIHNQQEQLVNTDYVDHATNKEEKEKTDLVKKDADTQPPKPSAPEEEIVVATVHV